MRDSLKNAIGDTVQDLINSGIKTSFTEKELKEFGIKIPDVEINAHDIQKIREKTKLSQSVFAKVLNVSLSSVRQWEQGTRKPTGSTKVLLELLQKQPSILNYRISSFHQAHKA
jgi:putative transcriptional regulator